MNTKHFLHGNPNPSNLFSNQIKEIGCRTGEDHYGNLKIAEIRFWNISRTSEQIKNNYDRYLIGNEPGLTSYYSFDNYNDNILKDFTGNNDGHIYNANYIKINE